MLVGRYRSGTVWNAGRLLLGAGGPERSAVGTEQEQGIRSRLPALLRQQQTEQMSRPGSPSGRAAADGSYRRLSTPRCGGAVALFEGASGQRGCIGWHVWGTFSVANGGRSRQKCSDRSASLRTRSTTASGTQSFPSSAGSPRSPLLEGSLAKRRRRGRIDRRAMTGEIGR